MPDVLNLLIQAENPLISIETSDERRASELVEDVARELARPIYDWSLTTGLRPRYRGELGEPELESDDADETLKHVFDHLADRTIYLFRDLAPHSKQAAVHRRLRDLSGLIASRKSTIILLDSTPLSDEVRGLTVGYDLSWPTSDELEQVVKSTFRRLRRELYKEVNLDLRRSDYESLIQSLRGLTCDQAERVIASAVFDDYVLSREDLPRVVEAKRNLLGSIGMLEPIVADFSSSDIGGLKRLKQWLKLRRGGFTREAREFGLEPPRGLLMLGVPGCGKSLCAKVVAADWHMPLLRLDPGVLYQKYIGESERQLRQALRQAEAMAPVVLWIDEIEKAFASAAAHSADGGLSKRMFGTLLSWMQDHRHPIFIMATANDISALPPELMRKGRFDEVFFVDLPSRKIRAEILGIHLKRRDRDPKSFDLARLAAAAEDFTGAELEQAVISALFSAFSEKRQLADGHLLRAIEDTRPLAVLNAEKITRLRDWATDRCVPAD